MFYTSHERILKLEAIEADYVKNKEYSNMDFLHQRISHELFARDSAKADMLRAKKLYESLLRIDTKESQKIIKFQA